MIWLFAVLGHKMIPISLGKNSLEPLATYGYIQSNSIAEL